MLSAALISYGKLSVFLLRETMPIVIRLNAVMLNAEAPVTESYLRLSIITLGRRYLTSRVICTFLVSFCRYGAPNFRTIVR
jgi:hypothetical protein